MFQFSRLDTPPKQLPTANGVTAAPEDVVEVLEGAGTVAGDPVVVEPPPPLLRSAAPSSARSLSVN
jgi:hypothetical protein